MGCHVCVAQIRVQNTSLAPVEVVLAMIRAMKCGQNERIKDKKCCYGLRPSLSLMKVSRLSAFPLDQVRPFLPAAFATSNLLTSDLFYPRSFLPATFPTISDFSYHQQPFLPLATFPTPSHLSYERPFLPAIRCCSQTGWVTSAVLILSAQEIILIYGVLRKALAKQSHGNCFPKIGLGLY